MRRKISWLESWCLDVLRVFEKRFSYFNIYHEAYGRKYPKILEAKKKINEAHELMREVRKQILNDAKKDGGK